MGFTCHPTTVQVQPLVSADYPGVACALVERELGAEACLFLQGACGNVGPVRATTDFRDVDVYGRALGGEALRCPLPAGSAGRAGDVARPGRRAGRRCGSRGGPCRTAPPWRRGRRRWKRRSGAPRTPRRAGRRSAAYRRVAEPLRLARLGTGPVRLEVQALRLGEALIVACEGELFVEYGDRLKDASPAAVTFVAAYSNGYEGYIPTPATWDEGGYEVSQGPWTRVGRDAGGDVLTGAPSPSPGGFGQARLTGAPESGVTAQTGQTGESES